MRTAENKHSLTSAARSAHAYQDEPQAQRPPSLVKSISPAEQRILNLAIRGATDKEICRDLSLSITTVRTHWTRLRKKLGVVNRSQAIAASMEHESNEQMSLLQGRVKAMHRALSLRGIGVWEWHEDSDTVISDEISRRIFARPDDRSMVKLDEFYNALPDSETPRLAALVRSPRRNGTTEAIQHHVPSDNGKMRLVQTKATSVACEGHTFVLCTTEPVS